MTPLIYVLLYTQKNCIDFYISSYLQLLTCDILYSLRIIGNWHNSNPLLLISKYFHLACLCLTLCLDIGPFYYFHLPDVIRLLLLPFVQCCINFKFSRVLVIPSINRRSSELWIRDTLGAKDII